MAKKDRKIDTPMMCVYAGPDSLYWKTGNLNDASKIDPDSETAKQAKQQIGAPDPRMCGVYAGPEAMSQPLPKQDEPAMGFVYAGPDSLYWKTKNPNDVCMLDPDAAKKNEAFKNPNVTQPNAPDGKKKFCPECGAPNALVNRFCTECGMKLTYPDSDKQG